MVNKRVIIIGVILIILFSIVMLTPLKDTVLQATIANTGSEKNKWNPSLQECSTQNDCIDFLKSNGINPILIDWVRCRDTCQFFDDDPETYTGEIQ